MDQWIEGIRDGTRITVVAVSDGAIVGYGSMNRREMQWFRHLAEIRVIVSREQRRHGLGGILAHEVFGIAKDSGLTKLVAQMAREQGGARKMFESLGFSAEALLSDWVMDRQGSTHDLLVMSYDVHGFTD